MIDIFKIMILLGAFTFFVSGLCVANSIEAKNSNRVANFLTILSLIGLITLIVGIVGYLILIH